MPHPPEVVGRVADNDIGDMGQGGKPGSVAGQPFGDAVVAIAHVDVAKALLTEGAGHLAHVAVSVRGHEVERAERAAVADERECALAGRPQDIGRRSGKHVDAVNERVKRVWIDRPVGNVCAVHRVAVNREIPVAAVETDRQLGRCRAVRVLEAALDPELRARWNIDGCQNVREAARHNDKLFIAVQGGNGVNRAFRVFDCQRLPGIDQRRTGRRAGIADRSSMSPVLRLTKKDARPIVTCPLIASVAKLEVRDQMRSTVPPELPYHPIGHSQIVGEWAAVGLLDG
jgi:hypothetical protein